MSGADILAIVAFLFLAAAIVSAMLLDRRKPNEPEPPHPIETDTPKAMKPRAERFVSRVEKTETRT